MAPSLALLDNVIQSSTKIAEKFDQTSMPNGHTQNVCSNCNGAVKSQLEIPESAHSSRKKMRIAIIGAGISGLNIFKVADE